MPQYRFVGTRALKEGVFDLQRFGQSIELSNEQAKYEICVEGLTVIPAEIFDKLFSAEEVKKYPTPHHQENQIPAQDRGHFETRRKQALQWLHDFREANRPKPELEAEEVA